MDRAEVGVLEEPNQVRFRRLLQRRHRRRLEPEVSLEVLSNLPHEPLEGELVDEELGALLLLADLSESDGPRAKAAGLLHTAGGGGGLAGGLGG